MDWRELARQILESQSDHPRRLVASSLGVLSGAATLVVLLAAGAGFREFMATELGSFGRGVVFLHPAATSSGFPGVRKGVPVRISRADARAAEARAAEEVEALLPEQMTWDSSLAAARGRVRRLPLSGTDERYARYRSFEIGHGRFFDAEDVAHRRAVAVIGPKAAEELFGGPENALGEGLRIERQPFEVIGVTRWKGRQYINVGRDDNELVIVPITTAEVRLGYDEDEVARLLLYPRAGVPAERAVGSAYAALGPLAGFHPDDRDAVKWFDTTALLGVIDLFYAGWLIFIGFAGTVTLLVGAVGIANYQLAILAERSVEIAVAKALGARNRVLVLHTLIEAGAVGGGVAGLGVALGLLACALLGALAPSRELPAPIVSPVVALVALIAVASVAITASLLPALRVRRMEVSTALRCAL